MKAVKLHVLFKISNKGGLFNTQNPKSERK